MAPAGLPPMTLVDSDGEEAQVGKTEGLWLGESDVVTVGGPDRDGAGAAAALGFPKGWPGIYAAGGALQSLLGRGGPCAAKRVRVVGPPPAAQQQRVAGLAAALGPAQSLANAERVRRAAGLPVVRGWAVFEHLPGPPGGAFTAERYWWNATPEGEWVDFTPRPPGLPELLLAEGLPTAGQDAKPRPRVPLGAPEAALAARLLRQRFGEGPAGEGEEGEDEDDEEPPPLECWAAPQPAADGRPEAAADAAGAAGRRGSGELTEHWTDELLRAVRACGSDDGAARHACREALAAFQAEARLAEMSERYFRSYALPSQEGMLGDRPRTEAFKAALEEVCAGGGLVLDVGCGSGVLSVLAAKAGADHVIAVEANRVSARAARAVVEGNGLREKVTVLEGQIEELAEVVDREIRKRGGQLAVLVSEFIGYCLVHEGMFASVAFARDRWRPRDVVPRAGDVYVCPFFMEGYPQRATQFWAQEHYGVDFSPVAELALRGCTRQPLSDVLDPRQALAPGQHVWHLDCTRATAEEAARMDPAAVSFEVTRRGPLHGICVYFTLQLSPGVVLSCSPSDPPTHWRQLMVLLHARGGGDLRPFPVLWPGDTLEVDFGFRLRHGRFLEISAGGAARFRGGDKPPWAFRQAWTVTPDPVIEPVDDEG